MKTLYYIRRLHAALVVGLVATLFMGACATSGVNRGDLNLVSLEEEWQLGQQLERDLARQLRLVNDPTVVNYINRIGQQIVSQTEMANLPWEFHVVADPEINAFNIPGGHVYVNTGLIEAADNVAELTGVIAHEIAHGVSRHGTERLTKTYGLSAVASLLLGQNPAVYEQILAQIIGTGTIARFSRNDERESDRLGVRYMYDAGYNPVGMATMFEKLMATSKRQPSAIEQFFSTHPLTTDRVSDVRRQASSLPSRSGLTTRDGSLATVKSRVSRY